MLIQITLRLSSQNLSRNGTLTISRRSLFHTEEFVQKSRKAIYLRPTIMTSAASPTLSPKNWSTAIRSRRDFRLITKLVNFKHSDFSSRDQISLKTHRTSAGYASAWRSIEVSKPYSNLVLTVTKQSRSQRVVSLKTVQPCVQFVTQRN